MKRPRFFIGIALLALSAGATAQDKPIRVPFSDPTRPGELHVSLLAGSIEVRGKDVKAVAITVHGRSEARDAPLPPRAAGLHRLPQQPSLTIEEQDNIVSVSSLSAQLADLVIDVPVATLLKLSTVNDGDITVQGVDSELEIGNVNGSITLTDVGGSVLAHTVNGQIVARLVRVTPQKPMSFTSLNGTVDVTLPASVRANLKLRTDRGSVLTDFDLTTLPQPSPTLVEDTRKSGGRYRIEVNKFIYGAVNGGGPDIELRTFNGDIYVRKGGGR